MPINEPGELARAQSKARRQLAERLELRAWKREEPDLSLKEVLVMSLKGALGLAIIAAMVIFAAMVLMP